MENEIVLFESEDDQVKLNVEFDGETVWLTKEQMAALFGRDRSVISRHISNIFREGEILEEGNVHYLHIANSDKPVAFYNLNVIISVGYRVKSKRGVEFRRRRQAYFRQRFGRAHHHDRRVEARRERGHGSIGYELPLIGVVRSAWRQEQDGARGASDWAWPSCCMRRAIWPVLSIPLYTYANKTG